MRIATVGRKVTAASIGQFGEVYDFAVFGFSAPIIASQFFPQEDPQAGLLSTFAVYAIAFFARPAGGLLLGTLADRVGRVRVLALTIWIMGAATALIGLLPNYRSVGIAAPLLLVLCRLAQGFSFGGETTGASSYILESAPAARRGLGIGVIWFVAQLPNALVALLLLLLQTSVGPEAYTSWVWRIPFLAGGLIGIIGYWIRRNLDESREFQEAKQAERSGQEHASRSAGLRSGLYVFFIQPVQTVGAYLLIGFMYTFQVKEAHLSASSALGASALAIFVMSAFNPIGGGVTDRIGRKHVMTFGAIWIACLAYPAIRLIASGTQSALCLARRCSQSV